MRGRHPSRSPPRCLRCGARLAPPLAHLHPQPLPAPRLPAPRVCAALALWTSSSQRANENVATARTCHFCGTVLEPVSVRVDGLCRPPGIAVPDVVRLGQNQLTEAALELPVFRRALEPFLFLNRLSSLRVLDLSSNRLRVLEPSLFESLPGLQSLFAQHNQFQTMSALEGLRLLLGLEKLALHGCPLHERLKRRKFRLGVLSLAPSVKQLDLTTVSPLEMADARQAEEDARSKKRASIAGTLKRPVVRARELGRVTTLLQRRVRQE